MTASLRALLESLFFKSPYIRKSKEWVDHSTTWMICSGKFQGRNSAEQLVPPSFYRWPGLFHSHELHSPADQKCNEIFQNTLIKKCMKTLENKTSWLRPTRQFLMLPLTWLLSLMILSCKIQMGWKCELFDYSELSEDENMKCSIYQKL